MTKDDYTTQRCDRANLWEFIEAFYRCLLVNIWLPINEKLVEEFEIPKEISSKYDCNNKEQNFL